MKTFLIPALIAAFCTGAPFARSEAPKVVKSVPENGAAEVDSTSKELRIVFDQPMSPNGMSVVGGGPTYPKFAGSKRWEDERTLVMPWQLEPEHEYWLSINSDRFTNFRGANGESSVPYPISFRTGKVGGAIGTSAPKPDVAANKEAIARLQRAIDKDYSYRDLRRVNWPSRFREFAPRLQSAATPRLFAAVAAELLSPAEDIHLWLTVGDETVGTHSRKAPWNVSKSNLPRFVPQWKEQSPIVASGLFPDGIRYVAITSWPVAPATDLEPAFEILADAAKAGKPIIVDVRANGGGSEPTAQTFAGCFFNKSAVYAKNTTLRDGNFIGPFDRAVEPNKNRQPFRGRSVVLMGQGTVSSSESFVMMMKQAPGCTLIGDRTAGCSGNPKPTNLGNGVRVFVPSWKDLRLNGSCLEGEGFAPDIAVKAAPQDFEKADPVLEMALRTLRGTK
jgi:Peptidase family S41/Bacterial Ig-like domain